MLRRIAGRAVRRATAPRVVPVAGAAGTWHETDPAAPYALRRVQLGRRPADLDAQLEPALPALGVLVLPRGSVVSAHGWVHDRRGRLVLELSWFGRHARQARASERPPRRPRRRERLEGRCLTLGTTWGGAFGHFLPDALGRLALVERAGMAVGDFDHVLVPPASTPAMHTLLERAGLTGARVRPLGPDTAVEADELVAPSFPGARRQYAPAVPPYLRSLARATGPPRRRLYVTRRGVGRNPVDADGVEALVRRFGFEVYDPAASADQATDFAEAVAVVGPSGAALQNVAFCPPGASVVELFSDAHVFAYHATLAQAARLRYGYVLGRSADRQRAIGASHADFTVDPDELAVALRWAVGPPA